MRAGKQAETGATRVWPVVVAGFLCALLLAGGISLPSPWMIALQSGLSVLVIAWALMRLAVQGFPSRLALFAVLLMALALALVLGQLVPLPPALWSLFPGREIVSKNLELMQQPLGWMPLTLSPEGTAADGIALLPAVAGFLAVLTVPPRKAIWALGGAIGCAIIGVGFALLQKVQGPDSLFYLYDRGVGAGTGTFNNRNFFAAQLYTSIPVLAAFAVAAKNKWRLRGAIVALAAVVYAGILLTGLSLSASRTGILLAMPAILFAVVLGHARAEGGPRLATSAIGVVALLLGFLVVGQASIVGLLRITQIDAMTDYRSVISATSLAVAKAHLPMGAGFGSFVPVYQMFETPDMMRADYVNHAHNDWLELVIEGGVPAALLIGLFCLWLVAAEIRIWRYGRGSETALFQRMASLVVPLLLIHSAVDYPLRTPALLTLFAFCCGLMTLQPSTAQNAAPTGPSGRTGKAAPRAPAVAERKPFQRPASGFGSAAGRPPGSGNLQ